MKIVTTEGLLWIVHYTEIYKKNKPKTITKELTILYI